MKINTYILSLLLILLAACSHDDDTLFEHLKEKSLNQNKLTTRSLESNFAFDEYDWCHLANGDSIRTPWSQTSTSTVPDDVRFDVKYSDGWRILYSNFLFIGCTHLYDNLPNSYYLILYNLYTGVLKGFYYASSVQNNNQAFWQLSSSLSNTKLFNFAGEFAKPANVSASDKISLSNVTSNGASGGFDIGWNCFVQELAYDSNSMNQSLNITAYAMNVTQYNFNGNFNSSSEGTIIASQQAVSPYIEGVANAVGTYAKDSIVSNLNIPGVLNSMLSSLAHTSTTSLVSQAVNFVVGSFLAQSTPTVQSLHLTTNGKMTLTGTSNTPMSGYISPISGVPLNALGKRLGVWNLESTPIYRTKYLPRLKEVKTMPEGYFIFVYQADMESVVSFVTNPDVGASISTSFTPVRYIRYDGGQAPCGLGNTDIYVHDQTGYNFAFNVLYEDAFTKITRMPYQNSYIINAKDYYPNYTSSNNLPAADFSGFMYEVRLPVIIKATANINCGTGSNVVSTKSFVPNNYLRYFNDRYDNWTYAELRANGYL